MRTAFKDPRLQRFYEDCRRCGNDPSTEFYYQGKPRRGAGHRAAYWNGRGGQRSTYGQNTFGHAAWRAGVDDLKEHGLIPGWEFQR